MFAFYTGDVCMLASCTGDVCMLASCTGDVSMLASCTGDVCMLASCTGDVCMLIPMQVIYVCTFVHVILCRWSVKCLMSCVGLFNGTAHWWWCGRGDQ